MHDTKVNRLKTVMVMAVIVLSVFIFQQFASKIGGFVAGLINYSFIDKDNTFIWISIHHFVQMLLALLIIRCIYKKYGLHFYLQPKLNRLGIKYVFIFSIVILCYVMISYLIGYKLNTITPYEFQLNSRNVLGTLGFQILLSGPSEEILFRALPMTIFDCFLDNKDSKNSILIFIAAILFSLAHITWSINPFTISLSWFQLAYAFILGGVYGIVYIKTKSIFPAMIMHSLSNLFMVAVGYIFAIVTG